MNVILLKDNKALDKKCFSLLIITWEITELSKDKIFGYFIQLKTRYGWK